MCSLTYRGAEFLWSADAVWPWNAPILFPAIGRTDESSVIAGAVRHMPVHGFARDMLFRRRFVGADRCELVLEDSEQTHGYYPFSFRLSAVYRLLPDGVSVAFRLTNPGRELLSAALGVHPGFVWPLPGASDLQRHVIELGAMARRPFLRAQEGMLVPDSPASESPSVLHVSPDLFADGAMVLDSPARRGSVVYYGDGPYALRVGWHGFGYVGLWSRPPGGFICIEPWSTLPSTRGYSGEWANLPGLIQIPSGHTTVFAYSVSVDS
jgi:galactose mutarotase-like enzyme